MAWSGSSAPIDFAGPPETFRTISYAKVMRGEFPAGLFQGALVIVGASSPILQDIHATSSTGGVDMAHAVNSPSISTSQVSPGFIQSSVDECAYATVSFKIGVDELLGFGRLNP